MADEIAVHPLQTTPPGKCRPGEGRLPQVVTMRAYEVYCGVYGKQEAMVTGGCRGGFSVGEIIAFLYAYPFPRSEWSARVDEAFRGMNL